MTERALNILWLSHLLPYPPRGGASQRSYHLLREAARRHRVHFVGLNQKALLPTAQDVARAVRHLKASCPVVRAFPIPWDRTSWHRAAMALASFAAPTPYETNWLHSPAMDRCVRELAASHAYDLIHVDTLGLMPYARRFPAERVVLTHHDIESHLVRRRAVAERAWPRRLWFAREAGKLEQLLRLIAPRVRLNLTVSPLDAERLQLVAGAGNTMVVENGVDVHFFRPRAAGLAEERGLVFAGSLACYPNRDAIRFFLSEVWPRLVADDPTRRVSVVGRDPSPELLAAAARDRRISVPGEIEDVRPFLAGAAIYVCPIRVGGGTRLKVLDALAMAKPLVATAVAVEGLDLVEGEHYLRAETPADYVAGIRRLEHDPALRRRLGQAGRNLVERRYAWEAVAEQLDRAYELALGRAELDAATFPSPTASPSTVYSSSE